MPDMIDCVRDNVCCCGEENFADERQLLLDEVKHLIEENAKLKEEIRKLDYLLRTK